MTQDIDDDDRVTASGSSNVEEEREEKGKVFTEVSIQVLYCTVLYCTVLYCPYRRGSPPSRWSGSAWRRRTPVSEAHLTSRG